MDIEERAKEMARIKVIKWFGTVDAYKITDNPYWVKRSAVIWHNAFYSECKIIGRDIK